MDHLLHAGDVGQRDQVGPVVDRRTLVIQIKSRHIDHVAPVPFPGLAGVGEVDEGGAVLAIVIGLAAAGRIIDAVWIEKLDPGRSPGGYAGAGAERDLDAIAVAGFGVQIPVVAGLTVVPVHAGGHIAAAGRADRHHAGRLVSVEVGAGEVLAGGLVGHPLGLAEHRQLDDPCEANPCTARVLAVSAVVDQPAIDRRRCLVLFCGTRGPGGERFSVQDVKDDPIRGPATQHRPRRG